MEIEVPNFMGVASKGIEYSDLISKRDLFEGLT